MSAAARSIGMFGAAVFMAMGMGAVQAGDRPFMLTASAAAEEDDDQVWALEAGWQRSGSQRRFSLAPEYAFNPTTSVQLEFTRGSGPGREVEVELKHLFNHIARDGWGWGLHLSLGSERDDDGGWQRQATLKVPWTLQWRDGDALLHLNAGLHKQRGERREWVASLAFEHRLPWRSSAFAELGRQEQRTLWQVGVRHWVRRERLAVDFSLQRLSGDDGQVRGASIGVGWYDL
jgi:hypothetical protein